MFKKSLLLMLLMAMFSPWVANAQETLTVYESETGTSRNTPIYNYYFDAYTRAQTVFPAADLAAMEDGTISAIKFYTSYTTADYETDVDVDVYLAEVDASTISSFYALADATIVYNGKLNYVRNTENGNKAEITITFTTPFVYNGGNLLFGCDNQAKGDYESIYYYGKTQTGASIYGNSSSAAPTTANTANFLPKTTFTYTPNPYKKPVNLDYANIDPTSTEVTWEEPITSETIAGYLYSFKKTSDTDWPTLDEFTTDDHIVLDALEAGTSYDFRVKTDYSSEQSGYATISFTTLESCMTPENLVISNITAHTADLEWTEGYGDGQWVLQYKKSTDENYTSVTVALADLPYTLAGLTAETTYNVLIAPVCDSNKTLTGEFDTEIACPVPTDLAVTLTPGDGTIATFAWTENGSATAWQLCIDGDESNPIDMDVNPFTYDQFTPEQTYTAKVRAVCGGIDGESAWSSTVTFTPTDAYSITVNDGTSTIDYVPFYGYYCDMGANSQFIIPATDLTTMQWGTINKLTFYSSTASASWGNAVFDVYFSIVNETTFASTALLDWTSLDTKVYTGSVSISGNKMEITISPFYYMGGNLLIGFNETTTGNDTRATWLGASTNANTAIYKYSSNVGYQQKLPKITFDYTPGLPPTCDMPTNLEIVGTPEAHKVVLQWTENGTATEWQLCLNGDETNPINVTENPYTLEGIASDTDFTVKVRAYCSDSDQSPWTPEISFHTAVACEKPTNLAITYNGGDTAEVSWDSESTITNFNIDVNGVVKAITGNTYSLTDLQLATTYTVKVQSDCGGGEVSAWVSDSFTTDLCLPADMCDITLELTDSYGDGWNGGKMEVVDDETDEVLGSYTISSSSASATYTLSVCNGRKLNFVYTAGDYGTENGWTIYDADGNVITEEAGCNSGCAHTNGIQATYVMNCPTCIRPKNLATSGVTTTNANLSWEGTSDSYVLQYRPWSQVGQDQIVTEEFVTYTYDLSAFTGMGSIAIRHYDVSDVFYLNVDNVVLTSAGGTEIFNEDFEGGAIPSTWTNYDVDGDGYTWGLASSANMNVIGDYGVYSASWLQTVGALTPDNWLIINNVELGGTFSLQARGQDPNYPAENFAVYVSLESDLTEVNLTNTSFAATNLTPGTPYAWQVKGVCGTEETGWTTSLFKTKDDVLVFATDGNWNDLANWEDVDGNAITALPTIANKVRIDADATVPAGVTATAGKTTIGTGSITVKDGGQLKQSSATIKVTMEKNIVAHSDNSAAEQTGWYFIASPFTGRTKLEYDANWSHVLNVIESTEADYDLYAFDPTKVDAEWVNYKNNPSHLSFLSEATSSGSGNPGLRYLEGYLYANAIGTILEFTGTASASNNNSIEETINFDDASTDPFNGLRLIGNPFTCNAYITYAGSEANFYVMNADGNGFELSQTSVGLAPCTGAFINFNATGKIQYSSEVPTTKGTGLLDMTLTQGQGKVDQARVRFGEGQNLKHMSFRENSSKLYIPQNEKEYAVVYADNQGEMPVCFKAEANGNYTIDFNTDNVEFGYLHLIDNMTGSDVDLLATPSYSFDAKYTDYASRFRLVFATGNADDSFAFIGNGEIILSGVNGNTTVQLFDVTGRMISSTNGANSIAIDNMAAGVYMIRLINGDNVKTQKIIVK